MKQGETERIIGELISNARADYQTRREAIKSLEELCRVLDDPLLVDNKRMAADVCNMLVRMLVGENIVQEGSIMHRLGLRLLDYIGRVHDEGPGTCTCSYRSGNKS